MSLWLSPVIALVLLAVPDAEAVRLELEPGLQCELGSAIGGALTEQQVKLAAASDASAWRLAVQREGEAVVLRMTNPRGVVRATRRLIPSQADCAALPRSVALLVKSWLAMRLIATEPPELAAGRPTRPREDVRPEPGVAAGPVTSGEPLRADASRPVSGEKIPVGSRKAQRLEAGLAMSVAAVPGATPLETHSAEPTAAPPVPEPPSPPLPVELVAPAAPDFFISRPVARPPRSPSGRSLSAILAGGGALGVGDGPVALGTATLEWGFFEPWAVAIDAGVETERRQTEGTGAVSVSLRWATLSLRRAFFADGMRGLHVSLGIQLAHLAARADGFAVNSTQNLFLPAAAANVEWRQPITAELFFVARFNVQARFQKQNFLIDSRVLVNVPEWSFGLAGGVGWTFL